MEDSEKQKGCQEHKVQENDDSDFQFCVEQRNLLLAARSEAYNKFDRAILLFTGGAIIVSLTVVKDIIPLKTAAYITFLTWSWISLAASLIFTVLSFVTSQKAFTKKIELWDKYCFDNNEEARTQQIIWDKFTNILNLFSLIFFLCGIILLLLFS